MGEVQAASGTRRTHAQVSDPALDSAVCGGEMTSVAVSFIIGIVIALLARVLQIPTNDSWRWWGFMLILNALFTIVRTK